jgi:hypothetical protein
MLVAALGATLEVALFSLVAVADFLLRMKELRPRILLIVDPKRPAKESFFLGTYSSPTCRSHAAVRSASCAKMRCRRLAIIPLRSEMRRKESTVFRNLLFLTAHSRALGLMGEPFRRLAIIPPQIKDDT